MQSSRKNVTTIYYTVEAQEVILWYVSQNNCRIEYPKAILRLSDKLLKAIESCDLDSLAHVIEEEDSQHPLKREFS